MKNQPRTLTACRNCLRNPCQCEPTQTARRKTGTARMQELGYRSVQIWISPNMANWLHEAAEAENQTKAGYILAALSARLAQRHETQTPSTHCASDATADVPAKPRRNAKK